MELIDETLYGSMTLGGEVDRNIYVSLNLCNVT